MAARRDPSARTPAVVSRLLGALAGVLLVVSSLAGEVAAPTDPRVRAADLRERLERLTSEEFQGREAGTEGARLASAYLAAQMEHVGLAPGGDDGTYFQPFRIPRPALGKGCWLAAETEMGTDAFPVETAWNPLLPSPNEQAAGPLVFAGYGITAPGRRWDDYAGVDVEGRVVLVLRKDPGWNDPRHAAFVAKLANAARHGAAALLVCNDVESAGDDDPIPHWSTPVGGRRGSGAIPFAFVRRAVAAPWIERLDTSLEDLERSLRESGPRSAPVPDVSVEIRTEIVASKGDEARNVLGLLRGSDPAVADEVVVVGAHFDHLGMGRFGSLGGAGRMHPGADDNASGTSAVVELAEHFAAEGNRPRRTLLFLAFTGEEKGLLGSSHWAEHPTVPLERVVAMVNLDMVGRCREGKLHVGGVGTADGLAEIVEAAGEANGLHLETSPQGEAPSDSLVFFRKHLPVLFLFTGLHGDYHRPSDTAEKIEYEGLERVTCFARDVIRTLADRPERLVYTEPPRPPRRPFLGVALHPEQDARGARVSEVTPGSPAEAAGVLADDVIVALGGHVVRSPEDLLAALAQVEEGKRTTIVVLRGEERVELGVVPARRGRR